MKVDNAKAIFTSVGVLQKGRSSPMACGTCRHVEKATQPAEIARAVESFPLRDPAASFGGVSTQQNLLLPPALRSLRLRAGMSQKALALTVGIDQATLCAVERGRKAGLAEEVMERVWRALSVTDAQRRQLRWMATHDGLVREAYLRQLPEIAQLISAAMRAYESLPPAARAGLIALLKSKAKSGADVRDLESLAADAASAAGEATMT